MAELAKDWLKSFKAKDTRILSRLISLAENQDPKTAEIFKEIYPNIHHAKIVGITGPPGAGKSSLIDGFIRSVREKGQTVAVVAVDPVSPFSGGALLGDRIRLSHHFNDPGVFIRSLSTRGKLGGLSIATREAVNALDAFGFDWIFIETVGVGQSEVDVSRIADITLVVLVPESGDSIQTLKAGLMEVGEFFIVNKADREGADRLVTDLKNALQISNRANVEVVSSVSSDKKSVEEVFGHLATYFKNGEKIVAEKRKRRKAQTAEELLEWRIFKELQEWLKKHLTDKENPYDIIAEFNKKYPRLFSDPL